MTSQVVSQGSLSFYYETALPCSIYFYKELQGKVLKFIGKLNKPNKTNNLYFDFTAKGNYYLFVSTPSPCILAV
jgi:hypothetical protein